MSEVRFVHGRALQFSLKWAECMKEFSVDIILMLPGDPFTPCLRKDSAPSRWEVDTIEGIGWMKGLSSESLNTIE
jgi:hypothetical protein